MQRNIKQNTMKCEFNFSNETWVWCVYIVTSPLLLTLITHNSDSRTTIQDTHWSHCTCTQDTRMITKYTGYTDDYSFGMINEWLQCRQNTRMITEYAGYTDGHELIHEKKAIKINGDKHSYTCPFKTQNQIQEGRQKKRRHTELLVIF